MRKVLDVTSFLQIYVIVKLKHNDNLRGVDLLVEKGYHLCLLDIMLQDTGGLNVAHYEHKTVFVLILKK